MRTIIVTGGGTGIGRAIASTFAAEGERVVLAGRRSDVLAAAAAATGGNVLWRACDVSDPDQVDGLAAWVRAELDGCVDVLINNAGGSGALPDEASTREAADFMLRILAGNLIGPYILVHALKPLLRRPGGRIVNISSIAAFRGGGDAYSAAKAGLVGHSYSLARELAPEGITVNVVAPGLVLDTEFFGDRMTEERKARIIAETPVGRAGRPEEIAAAVRFLASPEAGYVTGEVLHVNGGQAFGR